MNSNCGKYERLISDRLDGMIVPEDERILRDHLEHCVECQEFEASGKANRARLRALPEIPVDAPRDGSTKDFQNSGSRWVRRISLPLPAAAALALLALTGWTLALLPDSPSVGQKTVQPAPVRSVEIINVEPVQAVKFDPGNGDSTGRVEGEV